MNTEITILAAGCFWGVEHSFRQLPGVIEVFSGYTGGNLENPTYKQICSGTTGHAEAVQITFNPDLILFEKLLDRFWSIHDPTQLNRQGPDIGSQYRSAIFYTNETQKNLAQSSLMAKQLQGSFKSEIVTEITQASTFWKAEDYHQRYIEKNGGGHCAI